MENAHFPIFSYINKSPGRKQMAHLIWVIWVKITKVLFTKVQPCVVKPQTVEGPGGVITTSRPKSQGRELCRQNWDFSGIHSHLTATPQGGSSHPLLSVSGPHICPNELNWGSEDKVTYWCRPAFQLHMLLGREESRSSTLKMSTRPYNVP